MIQKWNSRRPKLQRAPQLPTFSQWKACRVTIVVAEQTK
jgi:hypothetical protein